MRRVLLLAVLGLLVGGAGGVHGQERMTTVRPLPSVDTTTWGAVDRPSAVLDSARRRILQVTEVAAASPGIPNPARSEGSQRVHPSLLVRQVGLSNVVVGRPPGMPPTPAGQTRIYQAGRRNAVLPMRMPWTLRVTAEAAARPLGGVVGARNRLLVVQGARTTPTAGARVGRVAQLGQFQDVDIRQMGGGHMVGMIVQRGRYGPRFGLDNTATVRQRGGSNLVRRILQSGAFHRARTRQRGAMNTLRLRQVGVDSTARVQQDGVRNVAHITQRSVGV